MQRKEAEEAGEECGARNKARKLFIPRNRDKMSLKVEVLGFGLCQSPPQPYSVFVVCVQQESFQAWTVYRKYASFVSLYEQLQSVVKDVIPIPVIDGDSLDATYLEKARSCMDGWMKSIALNPMILCTQSMYQFLCFDANMPPPFLEIHWRSSLNGSFDEMEMDDMFEGKHDENYDDGDDSDGADDTIWHIAGNKNKKNGKNKNSGRNSRQSDTMDDDGNDGINIQSLSFVEAEFIYDRGSESSNANATGTAVQAKRTINLDSFHIIKVIGKGSFGKVFLVREKATGKLHALKVLKKEYIIRKNQVEHTKTERSVLEYIRHPYIVGLTMAFQTTDKLFFVLDYCAGGELFFHLGKVGRFPEDRAKFYAAQIILALEHVHSLDVIYRDLKPENVLLDHLGNVKLTDFGLSKEGVSDHSTGANSFCGTPEYIAPEVLLRQGHGRAVDWWSLGALLFEMISGLPPFYSRNRETMFEKIMKAEITFPPFMTEHSKDILSKLLVRDPKLRLGSGERDAAELKEHPFFHDVDWSGLQAGSINPPWVPMVAGSLDTSQFDQEFTSMMPIVSPDVRDAYFGSMDKAFEGFSFVDENNAMMMFAGSVRSGTGATLMSTSLRR